MNLDKVPPELRPLVAAFGGDVDRLFQAYQDGLVSVDGWQEQFEAAIARYYMASMMAAAGRPVLTDAMRGWLEDAIGVQLGFLAGFALVLKSLSPGQLVEKARGLIARGRLYTLAIKQAWAMGDIVRQTGHVLPVPAVKAQGTICGVNCGCDWRIEELEGEGDYNCYWTRGKDDSCQTCVQRELEWNGPNGDGTRPIRIRDWRLVR